MKTEFLKGFSVGVIGMAAGFTLALTTGSHISNKDDCILYYVQDAKSDIAAQALAYACNRKFKG